MCTTLACLTFLKGGQIIQRYDFVYFPEDSKVELLVNRFW